MEKTRRLSRFLDPKLLAALSSMEIRARTVVEGMVEGLHKSPFKGFNVEFSEYRQYVPGDPLKDIDWKVYARTDKFYIKEHEEETNLSGYLVMDTSGSMSYKGQGSMSKIDYASTLAASLAYLMLKQQDSVGLVTFANGMRKMIRPRTGMAHLKAVCNELEATAASETTNIGASLDLVGQSMKKRGIFILFSDLMDNADVIIQKLRQLRTRRHEIVLFHVLDRDEISFPFDDTTIFHDLEDESEIVTDAFQLRSEYLQRVRQMMNTFKSALRKSGIDYLIADTSMPLEANLRSFFSRRQAVSAR
ncbi:MAG: hypothetical protein A2W80_19345 [Candidatus Riflebacteria bacterium GWC2_50_8]|nr:MAG: hypothetical protein A2W80_19345 [Candidatus Riflebacteria bacterium GWC2_50_8]